MRVWPRAADKLPRTRRLIKVGLDQPSVPCFRWILEPVYDLHLKPDEFSILEVSFVLLVVRKHWTETEERKKDQVLRLRRNSCLTI